MRSFRATDRAFDRDRPARIGANAARGQRAVRAAILGPMNGAIADVPNDAAAASLARLGGNGGTRGRTFTR